MMFVKRKFDAAIRSTVDTVLYFEDEIPKPDTYSHYASMI